MVYLLYSVLLSFTLPVFAAAWRRRSLDRPMLLVAAWYGLLVCENATAIAWSHFATDPNNLIVSQIFMPFEAALVLLAIAEWQAFPLARTTVRLCVPIYWGVWGIAIMFFEDTKVFSTFSGPFLAILVLCSALFAFVTRIQREDKPILDTAWGWILPGLSIFFAINATVTIMLAFAQGQDDWTLMRRASTVQAWIYLLATFIITWGYIWPTRHRRSGASSSPAPSP